jgi:hypothetical protein
MKRLALQLVPAELVAMLWLAAAFAQTPNLVSTPAEGQPDQTVRFQEEVLPILSQHCLRCHLGDESSGGLAITDHAALVNGGDSGPAIVLGDSAASLLIERVSDSDPESAMPPEGARLTDDQIRILRAWIDQGAEWDEKEYCLALESVELPENASNPIDSLLARYLKQRGLQPGPTTSDEVFARRVALDLVGVPLTSEQWDEFEADSSPKKRERLVERLLADHGSYVAHWMTFWSDHLRIGSDVAAGIFDTDQTKGPQEWLRGELERNVPFDRLVHDLIAGDFFDEYAKSIAPQGEVASHVDVPEMQLTSTVSQVFLGIQLKCASCHDSFVDRWKLTDAWGLAAAFGDGKFDIYRCDIPSGQTATPAFPLQGLGEIDPLLDKLARRRQIAELMTTERNGLFSRTIVNRIWARLLGRGFIEPLDEMMEHEPWNSELLDWLSADLVAHHYDLKHLLKLIATSDAYQASSVARNDVANSNDFVFAGPEIRRLTAEQFLDSISRLDSASSNAPARAWQLENNRLMTMLGRPSRDVVVTSREQVSTPLMELELINGELLEDVIDQVAAAQLNSKRPRDEVVTNVFRALLGRSPSANELAVVGGDVARPLDKHQIADVIWTIVMLPEFQLIR